TFSFFFFQAEDGIRDGHVTGVQTCALPIFFTEPRTSRAISAPRLAEIASHHASSFTVISSAEQALDQALAEAAPGDAIFITGSLYLVGQLRHHWKQREQVATH